MAYNDIIKRIEKLIQSYRDEKRYKEADEERDFWISQGFEVKQFKGKTKLTKYKKYTII